MAHSPKTHCQGHPFGMDLTEKSLGIVKERTASVIQKEEDS